VSSNWNTLVASFGDPHILQTDEWGQVKARFGWEVIHRVWEERGSTEAAALILQRTLPIAGFAARLRVMYVPKGPLLRDWSDAELRRRVLDDLHTLARKQGAIFIKIDPDVPLGSGVPETAEATENPLGAAVITDLRARGWHFSAEQIQFRNTVWIDLTPSEEELLARMKQKTRYNIRLAARKGVTVRVGTEADIDLLYRIYVETSFRDGFTIRDEQYYRTVWSAFMKVGRQEKMATAEPLIAEVNGEAIAAVIVFRFAGKAWFLYGMSRDISRQLMPNYLLQWEAMRLAKAAGCRVYDLWGAPDDFRESDPLWGVYRFKEGLGGIVVRTIGAWDYPVRPLYYRLYTQILPRMLEVMRRRGRERIQRQAGLV
jgi:lipid II:glycine glycyltransferase (peptidoglycan interpeptide bridge formation enzyme)